MSTPRACAQCRAAKVRCEFRPGGSVCAHCSQRGLACSGRSPDAGIQFRDENEVARRNSERARRDGNGAIMLQQRLDIIQPQSNRSMSIDFQSPNETREDRCEKRYKPWLRDPYASVVSEPLRRDFEERAVERFFIDWILHPSNRGNTPGHFSDLPALYASAPVGSALWHAVRAVAFADMKNCQDGEVPFYIKARRNYGAALGRIRIAAADEQANANDRFLAALLLVDNFELMYLSRTEPLGPHGDAVQLILHNRGSEQLHSGHSYALWRIAETRLQARHMLLRESPNKDEIEWMNHLNTSRPDIHVSADVLHMNILCAAATKLMQQPAEGEEDEVTRREQASDLIHTIEGFLESVQSWTSHMTLAWKPQVVDPNELFRPAELDRGNHGSPPLPAQVLLYRDIWLAALWNFHRASSIVMRETLAQLIMHIADHDASNLSVEQENTVSEQKRIVDLLADEITQSFPPLLGYTEEPEGDNTSVFRGKMAGRNFTLYPSWVLQRSEFTSAEHKSFASGTIDWIHVIHGLE